MRFDNQQRSAVGQGTNRRAVLEIGIIQEVDRSDGKCFVVTERGREVEVHIGTPMSGLSGKGLTVTPRVNSKCLVALFVSGETGMVRPQDGYLISTFQAENGDTEEWGAPGDFKITTDTGAEMLVSQGGIVNMQADPWARQSFLPDEKTIKQWGKNHERIHTTLAHDRTIHDDEAEVAFKELAINSRFMHRQGDSRPDVYRAVGTAQGSEEASSFHPKAGALGFTRFEKRNQQGQTQERLTRLEAGQEREILREQFEDLRDDNTFVKSIGIDGTSFYRRRLSHGDATWDQKIGKGIETAGEVSRKTVELEDTSLLFREGHFEEMLTEKTFTVDGEEVFSETVFDDGRVLAENPTWTVEMDAENKMEVSNEDTTITVEDDVVTIDNGSTTFQLDGGSIYVGQSADSESEPIALGQSLVKFLEQFKQWANTHTHPHPMGPTSPTATPFAAPTNPLLSKNNYVD